MRVICWLILFTSIANSVFAAETLEQLTLGVYCLPVDDTFKIGDVEKFEWPVKLGAVVGGVATKSPALDAGIGRFDIIVRVNNKEIAKPDQIADALVGHPVKNRVPVLVFRPEISVDGASIKWKKRTLRIAPVTLEQYFTENLKSDTNSYSESVVWEPFDASGIVNDHSGIVARVVTSKGKKPGLSLVVKYVAEDWLFVQSVNITSPGGKAKLDHLSMERDNDTRIWEWSVINVEESEDAKNAVKALRNASNANLEFLGRQYRREIKMPTEDLVNIRLMVHFYDTLLAMDAAKQE